MNGAASDLVIALGIFAGMFVIGFFLAENSYERTAYGIATLFMMAFALIAHHSMSTGVLP